LCEEVILYKESGKWKVKRKKEKGKGTGKRHKGPES
jgi:hypothetical protein